MQANLALAVYGAVLIGVMLAAPRGIQGALRALTQRTEEEHAMRFCVALAVAAALALAGCGSGDDEAGGGGGGGGAAKPKASAPGITATTVTVGGHFPLTGPAAPGYSEIPRAIDAYFQHVNANGGVHGRKLKMIIRDDGYNPVNTVKVTKQLVLQDKVFAILGGLGTPTHTKVVDYLNAAQGAGHLRVLRLPLLGRRRRSTRTRSAGSPTT